MLSLLVKSQIFANVFKTFVFSIHFNRSSLKKPSYQKHFLGKNIVCVGDNYSFLRN